MDTNSPLENQVKNSFFHPPIQESFKASLEGQLRAAARSDQGRENRAHKIKPYALTFAVLILLLMAVLFLNPGRVWAQIQAWFGYAPGIGIVDLNSSLKELDKTQTVKSGNLVLSIDRFTLNAGIASLEFRVERDTTAAQANLAKLISCQPIPLLLINETHEIQPGYLDSTYNYLSLKGSASFPIPAGEPLSEILFKYQCSRTGAGEVEAWAIPLELRDLKIGLPLYPVSTRAAAKKPVCEVPLYQRWDFNATNPSGSNCEGLQLVAVVEKPESTLLAYGLDLRVVGASFALESSPPKITDALGKELTLLPTDDSALYQAVYPAGLTHRFVLEFANPGLKLPLRISQDLTVVRSDAEGFQKAKALLELPEGFEPGEKVLLDQTVEVGSIKQKILSYSVTKENRLIIELTRYGNEIVLVSEIDGVLAEQESLQFGENTVTQVIKLSGPLNKTAQLSIMDLKGPEAAKLTVTATWPPE